jgi:hypothetical protein
MSILTYWRVLSPRAGSTSLVSLLALSVAASASAQEIYGGHGYDRYGYADPYGVWEYDYATEDFDRLGFGYGYDEVYDYGADYDQDYYVHDYDYGIDYDYPGGYAGDLDDGAEGYYAPRQYFNTGRYYGDVYDSDDPYGRSYDQDLYPLGPYYP